MLSKEVLKALKSWSTLIGILIVLFGLFVIIAGIIECAWAIIPGIFIFWSGFKIYYIKEQIEEILLINAENPYIQVEKIMLNVLAYLRLEGIVIIILTVFAVLALLHQL